ncbi:MAG TPA: SCO family protein [Methylomirabilota bacterium]|nr:SCO family protein [Methylomirabilota bacterium]
MYKRLTLVLGAACVALMQTACQHQQSATPAAGANSANSAPTNAVASTDSANSGDTNTQVYQVRGIIQRFDDDESVVIKHEEIPGYMQAMTMPFDVKDTNELAGLQPGDVVRFNLVITSDAGWIEQIKKTGETNVPSLNFREHFRQVREVELLSEGDKLPNYTFTNELGKTVRLHDSLGKPMALTFIFTRCPFPEYCPRMSKQFAQANAELKQAAGAPKDWQFYSITIDPEFDTPTRLLNYAKTYKYDPERWSFVTGAQIDIDAITEQFGVAFAWRTGSISHTLSTIVVDRNGIITRIFPARQWTAKDLTEAVIKAGQTTPAE